MIIKNELELHQESVNYIHKTFSLYKEVNHLNQSISNPIIHMYPVKDTYDKEGELSGYADALFFRVDVYDIENSTVYKGKKLHDAIMPFEELRVKQVKIFKDLSTMIALLGTFHISVSFASIDIEPVNLKD